MSARRIIAACLCIALLGGCADPITQIAEGNVAARPIGTAADAGGIQAGDQLKITLANDKDLTGTYTVSDAGIVTLPLLGAIQLAGYPAPQAADAIATALVSGGLFRNPTVTVEVLTLRPFYILGEVNKPGQYAYTPGISLFGAVATAGGYTYRANTGRVFIRKPNETAEREFMLDADIAVMPGDVIRIPERYF
jgi:polysaccharide export outer membrane protein